MRVEQARRHRQCPHRPGLLASRRVRRPPDRHPPVEGIQAGPSLTARVAAVQAVLSELTDDDAIRASRQVQQMRQELDLLDDQP
ncbi:hypothetical protein [Streptomyces mirabilis]|uniref:hypothetical protein n=1 Tax=Streptomyces mirabilis TaxID=68239 RepID=UPI00369034B1